MYKHRANKSDRQESGVGTKATGFDSCGPYSCMNCVWKDHGKDGDKVVDICTHPKVNADPELEDKKNKAGQVMIDQDDCCNYVRPPKGCK